ncbi:MAG: hypothetical protein KDB56_03705 [Mycobacterium sp.]|nr:hypothetical protein [Mycobacterium sp.]
MAASKHIGRVGGLAVALGIGAAVFAVGQGVAAAAPDASDGGESSSSSDARQAGPARSGPGHRPARAAAGLGAASAAVPNPSTVSAVSTVSAARASDAEVRPSRPGRASRSARVGEPVPSVPIPAEIAASTEIAAAARTAPAAENRATERVSVDLPPMPVDDGWSFTVSPDEITDAAANYVAGGGDPADGARFFFGDLAVGSLDALAAADLTPEDARVQLGNLAVSGYFGGIWLRDNLRETPEVAAAADMSPGELSPGELSAGELSAGVDLTASTIGIRIFDALATGLMGAASSPGFIARTAAHASVPVLLALYGYNRGYLDVLLENPPPGVPSMQDTLICEGFLDCNSTAFPVDIGTRYDAALGLLDNPPSFAWHEMRLWTGLLESATGAGRGVWERIAGEGGFSPASYQALVELSSAYLMISKGAVLASMLGYADGDTAVARSSLRLQAGLWIWSGAYFAGLASNAPAGTMPEIIVEPEPTSL